MLIRLPNLPKTLESSLIILAIFCITVDVISRVIVKICLIFGVWFERRKVDKKANVHEK